MGEIERDTEEKLKPHNINFSNSQFFLQKT